MVEIVTRESWGARPGQGHALADWSERTGFTVHYSSGPPTQTPRQIQDFHMDGRGWSDVGYNLMVDVLGTPYEGRGWTAVGAHAYPHNSTHIGVCFIGSDGDATAEAKRTIRALYDEACALSGRELEMTYHGGLPGNSTDCPGDDLRAWVRSGMHVDGLAETRGEADMIGLAKGDEGELVGYLQLQLKEIGEEYPEVAEALGDYGPDEDGVDEEFGPATAEALRRTRALGGSRAEEGWGDRVSDHAAVQVGRVLHRARFTASLRAAGLDVEQG